MPKIDNKYMGTFKCNDNKNYYFALIIYFIDLNIFIFRA